MIFDRHRPDITEKAQQRKIEELEEKLKKKDEVIAEIAQENLMIKKFLVAGAPVCIHDVFRWERLEEGLYILYIPQNPQGGKGTSCISEVLCRRSEIHRVHRGFYQNPDRYTMYHEGFLEGLGRIFCISQTIV